MKTILITGASSGFGLATARMLAKDNKLVLLSKDEKKLSEVKKEFGENAYTAAVDVRDRKQVENFYKSLPAEFGDIDVLVNNAGIAPTAAVAQEASLDDWELMVDTNIKGLLYMTRPALDIMVKKGSGLIVNMGSTAGHVPYKGANVYGATKAFVIQFSRNLRVDLFGTGVKVSDIDPGAALTNFSVVRFGSKEKADAYYDNWQPLKAEDVAETIVWAINQPQHVNIDSIQITPLDQAPAGFMVNKKQ